MSPTSKWASVLFSSLCALVLLAGCITIQSPGISDSPNSGIGNPVETENSIDDTYVSQEVDFSISGGCLESNDELGYYGIFEEFNDDCYLIVEVFPSEPARFAQLQYFDETWETDSSGTTDSGGVIYLKVDPFCDDGFWCDGVWEYRVTVDELGQLPAERSPVFELDFIPMN